MWSSQGKPKLDRGALFFFCRLGGDPAGQKFGGEKTKLIIGERNRIREHVTMNPGTEGVGV